MHNTDNGDSDKQVDWIVWIVASSFFCVRQMAIMFIYEEKRKQTYLFLVGYVDDFLTIWVNVLQRKQM